MISLYFKPSEFWAKVQEAGYPGKADPDPELVRKLDILRGIVNWPVIINSGRRGPIANAAAGGVPNSEHVTGEGADLHCLDSSTRLQLVDAAIKAGFGRIGIGRNFIHVGVSKSLPQNVIWTYYTTGQTN
jgi:uncharacterized protein YcbK (DUF882 family)